MAIAATMAMLFCLPAEAQTHAQAKKPKASPAASHRPPAAAHPASHHGPVATPVKATHRTVPNASPHHATARVRLAGHRPGAQAHPVFQLASLRPGDGKSQHGIGFYYGTGRAAGRITSSGEPLDPEQMTAASPNLPMGSVAEVTNLSNGRTARVRINDRGPFGRSAVIDVTPTAAERLGMLSSGRAPVSVTLVPMDR